MSNKEKTFVVYKHTCLINNKSYIGITYDYNRRCKQHQYKSSQCLLFSSAIQKHGWNNFTHQMLATGLTLHAANHFEEFYINHFNSLSPNGYNLKSGGDNSFHCEETKKKLSDAKIGEKHHNFGKFGTDNPLSKKYIIFYPSGDTEVITGLNYFCDKHGLNQGGMNSVLSGRYFHNKGYMIEYYVDGKYTKEEIQQKGNEWAKEFSIYNKYKKGSDNKNSKTYLIISNYGKFFIVKGLDIFCIENGLSKSTLNKVANGKYNQHKGYKCEFYLENKYTKKELIIKCEEWMKECKKYGQNKKGVNHGGSRKFLITTPCGDKIIVNGLTHFCKINGLHQGSMSNVASGAKKQHRGYKCEHYIEEIETKKAA
jgi:group I intron endonuclease